MVKQSSLQQLLLPFPSILPQIGRLLYSQQTSILVRFRRLSAGKTFTTNATTTISAKMATESYAFGPYKIHSDEVFYTTPLSYAFVNLRPVVPGHVLVCPKREVKRFADLTAEETTDLWAAAHRIAAPLENYHKASSLTFTIQDGPQAGQSVAHVHVHILPRKGGDFENNDDIYEAIDGEEKELKKKLNLDEERKDRNREEMAREAEEYRKLIL